MKLARILVLIAGLAIATPTYAGLVNIGGEGPATIATNAFGPTAAQLSPAGGPNAATLSFQGANTQSEVSELIVINADGTLSLYYDSSVGSYDGDDDVLIGVKNNLTSAFTSGVTITGYLNPIEGGPFSFDGDGISTYLKASVTSGNTSDTSDGKYGGPISYFTNINFFQTIGTVNFQGGLAAGSSTYFSLEQNPYAVSGGQAPVSGGGAVPEPTTLVMGATGAMFLLGYGWRRRALALKQ